MTTTECFFSDGLLLGDQSGGISREFVMDGRGSTVAISVGGARTRSVRYTAFGALEVDTDVSEQSWLLYGAEHSFVYAAVGGASALFGNSGIWSAADGSSPTKGVAGGAGDCAALSPAGTPNTCDMTKGTPAHYYTIQSPTPDFCGQFGDPDMWGILWKNPKQPGWVVQEIRIPNRTYDACCGQTDTLPGESFWESWFFDGKHWHCCTADKGGGCYHLNDGNVYHDAWKFPPQGLNIGGYTLSAWAKFIPGDKTCWKTWNLKDNIKHSGCGYASASSPPGWSRVNSTYRLAHADWKCCQSQQLPYCDCIKIPQEGTTALSYGPRSA